jgi:signal transduction histidine kinase
LISNAIKFTNVGGEIKTSAQIKGSFLEISVADNGIGIAPENLEKIFKIDESFTTPGTLNEKGTGLGLILSKEFVENNKGKIRVVSEYGKGSTFIFTLPKQNPETD